VTGEAEAALKKMAAMQIACMAAIQ